VLEEKKKNFAEKKGKKAAQSRIVSRTYA